MLHGADEHYDSGAFKAVYHLLLAWAVANQVRRVDFFGTEAFISNGIYFHDSDRPARQDISAKVRSVLEPKLVDLDRFLDPNEISETTFSIP